MPVFFVYVHDGEAFSMDDMEVSPNAEVVRRELASRVRTGAGKPRFVADMDALSPAAAYQSSSEDEWPAATDNACMVVWRSRSWSVPTGQPDEMWLFSGNVDRPTIVPADLPEKEPVPTPEMRVSDDVFRRRVSMGWDPERARTTPLGVRSGSYSSRNQNDANDIKDPVRRTLGVAAEIHTAFGMTRSIPEWHDITGISESALRVGAKKHGLEQYLKKKHWHPRWGKL